MPHSYAGARHATDQLGKAYGGNSEAHCPEARGRPFFDCIIYGHNHTSGAGDTDVEAETGGLSDASCEVGLIGHELTPQLPTHGLGDAGRELHIHPPPLPLCALPGGGIK